MLRIIGASMVRRSTSSETLPPPSDLRVQFITRGGEDLAVLSYAIVEPEVPKGLTRAESEIVRALIRGQSNSEIAAERGRSTRTIANQIAAVFKKLSVRSRTELVARLTKASSTCRTSG